MKTVQQLTSVFNIPEIEEGETDYRKLYEKEKKMRVFYERKTRELQAKLRTYMCDNRHQIGRNKRQEFLEIMQDIKSFKSMLPNSVKDISIIDSDLSISARSAPPLLKQWAIYGLTEEQLLQLPENATCQGSTVASNQLPSQILEHSAKLTFPSGTSAKRVSGRAALDYSLEIINLSKEKLKSFILTFEPTCIAARREKEQENSQNSQIQIIDILNSERKMFAVCIELEEFTIVGDADGLIELQTHRNNQPKKVRFGQLSPSSIENLTIIVSKRVYSIFTYYPFFGFFEELLKSLLYAVKVERYIRYKEGGENLGTVDSRSHSLLMKNAFEELRREALSKAIVADKLLDFSVCGSNKAYLQLSRESLTFCLAQEWAYYVLQLFTLDVFLDVLTLLMLQQKIVFVCSNATILTHAIFLFTKVLIRPFDYPYPVVNLIPDQEEYLNAPFPVVYGYLKTKSQLLSLKVHKQYKNVYVFFEPDGVEILTEQDKKKVLNKKSPRLRDRLISKFKKMRKNYPSTLFFSFMQKKNVQFQYPVNIELARQIMSEVYSYFEKEVFQLLPSEADVESIRNHLLAEKNIEEEDLNHQIFVKIKEDYSSKSKDPFFAAFLETQLFNVHIFKY